MTSSSPSLRTALHEACSPRPGACSWRRRNTAVRDDGWDAVHVSDIGMQTADDIDILNVARSSNRICITLDHDFHAHIALTR